MERHHTASRQMPYQAPHQRKRRRILSLSQQELHHKGAGSFATLEGAVTAYRTVPAEFGEDALATRVEAAVTLQATLRELASDKVLWSQDGLVYREQFDVKSSEDISDREILALDEIARGAAGALVSSILEGF